MVVRVWHKAFAVWLAIVSAAFAGTEHYDYDALGRLIRFVSPDGRVTEYVYDGVGNILEVRDITGPPAASLALTSVSRDSVRRRQSVPVSVAGNALLGATVTSPDASLLVSDLRSNPSEVHFTLSVAETAPLGPHAFTLSSSLGATDFTLTGKPGLPPLVADPSPVVLAPGGDAIEILLTLGNPDEEDHRIDLAALSDIMKTAGTKNVPDLRRIEAPLRTFGSMCIFCQKNTQRG